MPREATDTTPPSVASVFYDGDCRLCVEGARRFEHVLGRRHVELVPLQVAGTSAKLGVPEEHLLDEMRLRLPDGTVLGGAAAVVEVARRIWWAWPLWALSRWPGAMAPMSGAYRLIARHRHCATTSCEVTPRGRMTALDILPLIVLPAVAFVARGTLPNWGFMWAMAFAIYSGCKWLTYREARGRGIASHPLRAAGYLFLWPGMDAEGFLAGPDQRVQPRAAEWIAAILKTLLGAIVIWVWARLAMPIHLLLGGWVGMAGAILVLHFGTFDLLSLAWRSIGVNAMPVMQKPLRSRSLGEFWGRRWNTAFHELATRFTFAPLRRLVGPARAALLVFLVSGVIHELVISVPANGGYGLPTGYFVLQGLGVAGERTLLGRRLGLGRGWRGWAFTVVVVAGPAFWLFPPPFVYNVILPMLAVIGAT